MLSIKTKSKLSGIKKRTLSGKRVRDLFKTMINNPDLWLMAYANIQSNQGSTTAGIDGKTFDGFSKRKAEEIVNSLKNNSYKPTPVKRVYIPKNNGKKRPLGIPTITDRLVQEVARALLEQVYEPIFEETSHGFRPNKSCHTAIKDFAVKASGAKWFIEFDIKGYFDNINHKILINLLEKRIDDRKFIKLIKAFLKAGYLEDWKYYGTYSGTPQGGIISPLLANVYLNELDAEMKSLKTRFDKGKQRKVNPEYKKVNDTIGRWRTYIRRWKEDGRPDRAGKYEKGLPDLNKIRSALPTYNYNDHGYKRLQYVRYADDFLISIIGSKVDAEAVRCEIEVFLDKSLKLETSPDKTKTVHVKDGVMFLGYKLIEYKRKSPAIGRRSKKGRTFPRLPGPKIQPKVPMNKVKNFVKTHGYGSYETIKGTHRNDLLHLDDAEIISKYNAELRGFANYYALAVEWKKSLGKLFWLAELSAAKTLAGKHKISMKQAYKRYHRPDKGIRVSVKKATGKVRHIDLVKLADFDTTNRWDTLNKNAKADIIYDGVFFKKATTSLIARMNANHCEFCGTEANDLEVHHIRKMKDLKGKKAWEIEMIGRKRKTLVLCKSCHQKLHAGTLHPNKALGQMNN